MFGDIIRKTVSLFGKAPYAGPVVLEIAEVPQETENVAPKTRMEFNIGIFGTVSAGKSTLINAIFSKHLSQMSIRRTTMVPQRYQLVSSSAVVTNTLDEIRSSNEAANTQYQSKVWDGETIIHHTVENPDGLITIEENSDFQYNIYDFPGMNDQTTKFVYTTWTTSNIAMFDVIILVVDIHSGLNTSDEIDVLRVFLSGMLDNPHIKLVVLANKCDDMLYDEATDNFSLDEEKETIYTEQMVPSITRLAQEYQVDMSRITIQKFCSRTAFIYRTIHSNGTDVTSHLDQKHLTEMMQYEVGRTRWVRMTESQREQHIAKTIKDVVDDDDAYRSVMIHSGFTKFADTIRELTTNQHVLLPVYRANVNSVLSKVTRNSGSVPSVATFSQKQIAVLEDTVILINGFTTGDDVKESLLQSVLDKFDWAHKHIVCSNLQTHKELITSMVEWKVFVSSIPFCSDIQRSGLKQALRDKLANTVAYLKSSSFQDHHSCDFVPASFPLFYDTTLRRAASGFKDISDDLLTMIPLNHTDVWNNTQYLSWFGRTLHGEETLARKLQEYITFFLNEQLSSVTQTSAMFLHYIKYHKSYDKLDFINKVCVDQHLYHTMTKGVGLDHTSRENLETMKCDMMKSFGSFFDTLMELL